MASVVVVWGDVEAAAGIATTPMVVNFYGFVSSFAFVRGDTKDG